MPDLGQSCVLRHRLLHRCRLVRGRGLLLLDRLLGLALLRNRFLCLRLYLYLRRLLRGNRCRIYRRRGVAEEQLRDWEGTELLVLSEDSVVL